MQNLNELSPRNVLSHQLISSIGENRTKIRSTVFEFIVFKHTDTM